MLGLSRMAGGAAARLVGHAGGPQVFLAVDHRAGTAARITVVNPTASSVAYWVRRPDASWPQTVVLAHTTASQTVAVANRVVCEDKPDGQTFRGVPIRFAYPWSP